MAKNIPNVQQHLSEKGLSLNNVSWRRGIVRGILGSRDHKGLT